LFANGYDGRVSFSKYLKIKNGFPYFNFNLKPLYHGYGLYSAVSGDAFGKITRCTLPKA
jgi:hypothetical protein